MDELYKKLKKYSLEDAVELEKTDRQFLALKSLHKNKAFSDEIYLFLTIANALVCYQLSGKGEEYWEEFAQSVRNCEIESFDNVREFFVEFLPTSKNNKRFVNIKLKRIGKLKEFYSDVFCSDCHSDLVAMDKWKYYYKNMDLLAQDLASVMGQRVNDKTIVFAVKMFGYAGRNTFGYIEYFPKSLMVPVDSRLESVYKKYTKNPKIGIEEFYKELSQRLNIQPLHLDGVLWINYDNLMN